jgi:hypothetical protein
LPENSGKTHRKTLFLIKSDLSCREKLGVPDSFQGLIGETLGVGAGLIDSNGVVADGPIGGSELEDGLARFR